MPTLLQMIEEYGAAMYDAGVYEKEDGQEEHASAAEKILSQIERLLDDGEPHEEY